MGLFRSKRDERVKRNGMTSRDTLAVLCELAVGRRALRAEPDLRCTWTADGDRRLRAAWQPAGAAAAGRL
jgi:hypothetical protein